MPGYDFTGQPSYFIPLRYNLIPQGHKLKFIAADPRRNSGVVGGGARSAAVDPGAI